MGTKRKLTTEATASMRPPNMRSSRLSHTRRVQNFLLIWLGEDMGETNNDDCCDIIAKLRQVINTVDTFTDVDECIDFISSIKDEKIFMIISGTFSETIVPIVQDILQVTSIYIFCEDKIQHEQFMLQWSKVKGVFTDIIPICEVLKQAVQNCDRNMVSISIIESNDETSEQNLDRLDQSFMYTQILKDTLLTIDFEQEHIDEFITYYREQFAGNNVELKNVDKLEKEYHYYQPIWWYTNQCFLYSTLNRALRLMEVDLIIKMGFFVRDLHKHITELHAEQYGGQNHMNSFIVYRGQGLSLLDFKQLTKTQGGLLSFNTFLSTSFDRTVSFAFAESNVYDSDLVGVLFEITINPLVSSTSFASIRDISNFQTEEEILFSMHSVFRIGQVKQLDENNHIWQVSLVLTNDNDPQLHTLTKCISKEISSKYGGWHQLGSLLIRLGQFNKAEVFYDTLLKQTSDMHKKISIFSCLAHVKQQQGKYKEAVLLYGKLYKILRKALPPDHPNLTTLYNSIGSIYENVNDYPKSLSYYEKALEITKKLISPSHSNLAGSYIKIGSVYAKMGEYSKALSYHEKALEVQQETLPPNHPNLAASYNNIGTAYDNMKEYSNALLYQEKALEIRQKTLSPNHPNLATSYSNIGSVHLKMGEYPKALSHLEKALEIKQKTLSPNHPNLGTSYNNIGLVHSKLDAYSEALSYYEKALEIFEKTLPPNHPSLAASYNNIGLMYKKRSEYPKALSYYERSLNILQCSSCPDHPNIKDVEKAIRIVKKKL